MITTLNEFKDELIENMSGLIAFTVTEIETGASYISHSNDDNFDVELMGSYSLEVLKAKVKAAKALNMQERIADITITFENQLQIIDLSEDANYFIFIAIDSSKTNLGIAKSSLKKAKLKLNDNL